VQDFRNAGVTVAISKTGIGLVEQLQRVKSRKGLDKANQEIQMFIKKAAESAYPSEHDDDEMQKFIKVVNLYFMQVLSLDEILTIKEEEIKTRDEGRKAISAAMTANDKILDNARNIKRLLRKNPRQTTLPSM